MPAYTCGGCRNTWTGLAMAHCSACHQTFGSVNQFDRHRSQVGTRGTCLSPPTIVDTKGNRVMFYRNGAWRSPELSPAVKATLWNLGHARSELDR